MVTCLKINTVMDGFKVLDSHNRSVSDLYFTIFVLPIMFYIAACIHYSCIILMLLLLFAFQSGPSQSSIPTSG